MECFFEGAAFPTQWVLVGNTETKSRNMGTRERELTGQVKLDTGKGKIIYPH